MMLERPNTSATKNNVLLDQPEDENIDLMSRDV